jgi:ferredoxin
MKSMNMKVIVDQDICASSGNCVMNAPEVFDQRDDDGVVVLLNANPPAEQAEGARRAAAACPALAIRIEE